MTLHEFYSKLKAPHACTWVNVNGQDIHSFINNIYPALGRAKLELIREPRACPWISIKTFSQKSGRPKVLSTWMGGILVGRGSGFLASQQCDPGSFRSFMRTRRLAGIIADFIFLQISHSGQYPSWQNIEVWTQKEPLWYFIFTTVDSPPVCAKDNAVDHNIDLQVTLFH